MATRTREGINLVVRKLIATFGFDTFNIDKATESFIENHDNYLEGLKDPFTDADDLVLFIHLWLKGYTLGLLERNLDLN